MKWLKRFFSCLMVMIVVAAVVIGMIAWQSYRFWLQTPAGDAATIVFIIEEGSSLKVVAQSLKEEDLIASAFWFRFYTRLDGSGRSIQVGTFQLSPGMSYVAVVDELTNQDASEVSITIPEGYTLDQIGEVVMANFDVSPEEWEALIGADSSFEDHPFIVSAQKPDDLDLEGYLFPDTYRFFVEASGDDIVQRMIETLEQRIEEKEIVAPEELTMHEVITLASIVEREVRSAEDMANVADVFLKRLDIGMALQADSTVNYVTGKDTPAISLDDREIESPYNTYKYPGLPPGPISNPGVAALQAVVNPSSNPYLYFLTTPEGEVIYAQTHEGHVENKAQYLR